MNRKPLSLQINVPFCQQKCGYCDRLIKTGTSTAKKEQYIHALYREIESTGSEMTDYEISSLRLKGGRVNDLGGALLKELLDVVYGAYSVRKDAEIVMDIVPAGISAVFLEKLRNYSRIRFHMEQGTFDPLLHLSLQQTFPLNAADEVMEVFRTMHRDEVTISLLYGLQGQGIPSLRASLGAAVSMGASSISLKELRLSEGTCVREEYEKRRKRKESASADISGKRPAASPRYVFPDSEKKRQLYDEGRRFLEEAGFIAQTGEFFCREGHRSRFVDDQAAAVEELGIGLGACSRFDGILYQNTWDLSRYLEGSDDYEKIINYSAMDTPEARKLLIQEEERIRFKKPLAIKKEL